MIVGLGIDISEVDRIREAIERHGDHLLNRIYTPAEIAYCKKHRDPYERYAARFAAKEAAMKALGTGWRHGVRWVDIEVARMPSGQPTIKFYGETERIAASLGVKRVLLTITHSGNIAMAQVIFEG
jgi:holo-[acyl-carrier protein] synthase